MTHVGALALILATTTTKKSSSSSVFFLILIVGFGALYFFFLRPQQAKARKAREETRNFEVGDEIVTVGGIVGRVVDVEGDRVTVLSGEGHEDGDPPTRLVLVRQAIARKADPPAASVEDEHEDEHEDEDHEDEPDDTEGRSSKPFKRPDSDG